MQGARGMVGQSCNASQVSRGALGMVGQNLNGNKKVADRLRVIASGFITPAGSAGSEYGVINMTTQGAAVGDFIYFFMPLGNGVNSNGAVDQHTGGAFTTSVFAWPHGSDGFISYATLDANHLLATAMRVLCRSSYRLYYCIVRSLDGTPTTGTLVGTYTASNTSAAFVTIPGYTKSQRSKGHITSVIDRDPTTTFVPPSGHTAFDIRLGSSLDGVFSRGTALLPDPSSYVSGTGLTWTCLGAQTYDNSGFAFELT